MRSHLGVRLSYEAKYMLEYIQTVIQEKLDSKMNKEDVDDLEKAIKLYLKDIDNELGATSVTLILKSSASSVLEEAFYKTKSFSLEDWHKIDTEMKKSISSIPKDKDVGTLSVRFFLENSIITGLENYQKTFMTSEMVRQVRLSYVIKLLIYAYYKEIMQLQ
ncbi:Uncharacterised protein [Streptococcus pneumoniae]|uniref:Uncharacterized protein n=2 Tax=Streptococcus pneumoniae TaxID=1313 RepID=A0A4J1TS80_STREE|nr:Uncharacterised protein [Streptococcus pneumoniae]COJ39648.1 Uncharacterised protein [Streptococcus pneumoniae]VNP35582.1 Uncharacterised protein [Streptococcus pneumoniae]